MLITRLYCNDIWKEEFMQTCLCILQGYRYLFVAIILNVPETQFLHCPILFCVIFIIIFCSKCLINWVKSCIYFAYWLIQATHYLPVDCIILLWNWCRCLNLGAFTHKLHTCLNLGRCMAFVNTLLPQTDKLWALEMWTDFRAVSCSFQEQQQMWTYSLRVALE